ncbi:hypothetical protein [Chryseobacterium sp. c4a]|uniref:hypothetical protein n=1 Tax=Chryseobacterium sp. c4a TaxID=1573582 RepID=UPI001359622D|nr:hypothetical protein [Chryseobacterium sp. c4a]
MTKSFFYYLSCVVCFASCNTTTSPSIEEKHITEKVNRLYHQYGSSNEAIYRQPVSNTLFSPELKKTIETAIDVSKADIEKVKNSDHPDEKPLLFEGAIFSSLYEGYTGYTIKRINIHNNVAEVIAQFEYNLVSPKLVWTDTIQLINIDKDWKINNIIFDKKVNHSTNLTMSLNDFIRSAKQ